MVFLQFALEFNHVQGFDGAAFANPGDLPVLKGSQQLGLLVPRRPAGVPDAVRRRLQPLDFKWPGRSPSSGQDQSDGQPNGNNGPFTAYLRKTFTLPWDPAEITSARVTVAVDGDFTLYVNGQRAYADQNFSLPAAPYEVDIKGYLVEGTNVLALNGWDSGNGKECPWRRIPCTTLSALDKEDDL